MGGSKWMKVKLGLGLNLNSCLQEPRTIENSQGSTQPLTAARFSDVGQPYSTVARDSGHLGRMPISPTASSSGIRMSGPSSKNCEKICSICLVPVKPGNGHAIFTAECSHSFHFQCIASNVKHGRQTCPVCRTKWRDIPFQSPALNKSPVKMRPNHGNGRQHEEWFRHMRRVPSPRADNGRNTSVFEAPEPGVYDDDDEIVGGEEFTKDDCLGRVEVKTYCEVSAVPKLESHKDFLVLVHLKAPSAKASEFGETSRAAVDLVTVLDVSGSMSGSKLALLKRAMGFVIQNLGPSDRLSVIVFSSTARRLFPLRRMTDSGRQFALLAVNSLSSNGGTNIAEGLKKGAKVMTDRKSENSVSSMILLSDGQDTYNVRGPNRAAITKSDYKKLLPVSGIHVPVHTFGFGSDHDAVSMHLISESSGGTFSFIESENVIQDAFAQCIGGLLSVVVQELKLKVECIHPLVRLGSVKSGSYKTILSSDRRTASVDVGDLYAEEARDFLVTTDVPSDEFSEDMSLLKVSCVYENRVSRNSVKLDFATDVRIQRPFVMSGAAVVSREVDRQRNRIRTAEAMAEAKVAAEKGDLSLATSVLENCRKQLLETVSAKSGDPLVLALIAELTEAKERMANRQVYETSGRAYVLSGLSSHSWQRATARGHSTDGSGSFVHAYQTPSMVDMVNLSQTTFSGGSEVRSSDRNCRSFPVRPDPR